MEYLFQITIGPVQEFIAAARRSRDLWYGSWLLSELSRAAAMALQKHTLIFPSADVLISQTEHEPASVANKILAIVTTEDIASFGESIRQAIVQRLQCLCKQTFDRRIQWEQPEQGDRQLAEQQVNDMLECYWAAVPFESGCYRDQRAQLEHIMAARKATRDFSQVALTEAQGRYPKSSLDGQRESVIYESAYPSRSDDEATRLEKLEQLLKRFGANQSERLSGVDLLKRRGTREVGQGQPDEFADFPSTSHFAALPFIHDITRNTSDHNTSDKVKEEFKRYCKQLQQLFIGKQPQKLHHRYQYIPALDGYDASILFMTRLPEEIDVKNEQSRSEALKSLQQFFQAVSNGAQPGAYYALLQADGDNMGKVIDNQQTPKAHSALSKQLASFADNVRGIVEKHQGALIYAGGDDVLAFLPLHTVLACAKKLHDKFDEIVGSGCPNKENQLATLSVGIAVVHHLEPLSDALALVRRAEQAAKRVQGKNGLAIAVEKRSGEPRMISGSWKEQPDSEYSFFRRLATWKMIMGDSELSAGLPYELLDLVERLGEPQVRFDEHKEHSADLLRAIAEEAARIIERKRSQRGEQDVSLQWINAFRRVLGLTQKEPQAQNGQNGRTQQRLVLSKDRQSQAQIMTVRQLADELIVAHEFARSANDHTEPQGAKL